MHLRYWSSSVCFRSMKVIRKSRKGENSWIWSDWLKLNFLSIQSLPWIPMSSLHCITPKTNQYHRVPIILRAIVVPFSLCHMHASNVFSNKCLAKQEDDESHPCFSSNLSLSDQKCSSWKHKLRSCTDLALSSNSYVAGTMIIGISCNQVYAAKVLVIYCEYGVQEGKKCKQLFFREREL